MFVCLSGWVNGGEGRGDRMWEVGWLGCAVL